MPTAPSQFVINADSPQADGLTAWLPTGDGSSYWLRERIKNAAGRINGTYSWVEDATLGRVLDLEGASIRFTDNWVVNTDVSFAGWVWLDNWSDNSDRIFLRVGSSYSFGKTSDAHAAAQDNCLCFWYHDGTAWRTVIGSNTQLASGQFHHVAIVCRRDDDEVDFYVNGSLVTTTTDANGLAYPLRGGDFTISGDEARSNPIWGRIADFRVYAKALDADDVTAIHTADTRWDLYREDAGAVFDTTSHGGSKSTYFPLSFRSVTRTTSRQGVSTALSGPLVIRPDRLFPWSLPGRAVTYSGRYSIEVTPVDAGPRTPVAVATSGPVTLPRATVEQGRLPIAMATSGPVTLPPATIEQGRTPPAAAFSGPYLFPEGTSHLLAGSAGLRLGSTGKLFAPQTNYINPNWFVFFVGGKPVQDTANIFTDGEGQLNTIFSLAGTVVMTSQGQVAVTVRAHPSGTAALSTAGQASLVSNRYQSMGGQAAIQSATQSVLNATISMVSNVNLVTVGSADPAASSPMEPGPAHLVTSSVANLESPKRPVAGTAEITTDGEGLLDTVRRVLMAGTAALTSSGTASPTALRTLSGSADLRTSDQVVFAGTVLLDGSASVLTSGSGGVSKVGMLAGSAALATGSSVVFGRRAVFAGEADLSTSGEAALIASRLIPMTGTAAMVTTTQGQIVTQAAVGGTAALVLGSNDGYTRDEVELPGQVLVYNIIDTLVLDSQLHWNAWSGYKRVHGDSMALAYTNMAESPNLKISNRLFHFRWGTKKNLECEPAALGSGVAYSTGTRVLEMTEGGIRPTAGTGVAFLEPPGPVTSYQFLYESPEAPAPVPPAPGGVWDSVVTSFWGRLDGSGERVLVGGRLSGDQALPPSERKAATFVVKASTASSTLTLTLEMHTRTGTGEESFFTSSVSMPQVNSCRHYTAHSFFTRTETEKWWHCRWFADGFFQKEDKVRLDTGGNASAFTLQGAVRAWMSNSRKPVIFAERSSTAPWSLASTWGADSYAWQSTDEIDELMVARCHPVCDEDDNPIITHTWVAGTEVFRTRRHPVPSNHPTFGGWDIDDTRFVMRSPVWFVGHGSGAGIYRVRIDYTKPSPTTGQSVAVAVRASNTPYAQDDEELPWSDWQVIDDSENGQEVSVMGGGYGNFVQMRLRLLPSSTGEVSPQVTRVQYWARFNDVVEAHEDLPASVVVGEYLDLPMRVLVQQTAEVDLPGRLGVVYAGEPVDLPARSFVYYVANVDLPARCFQSKYRVDLPARLNLYNPFLPGSADLAGKVVVKEIGFDLPARVQVPARFDLPARTTVGMHFLPARVGVQKSGFADLAARTMVPPERPGTVAPVTADVTAATWQSRNQVRFAWRSAGWVNSPILAYYWTVNDSRFAPIPNDGWEDTPLLSRLVDLTPYGSGKRWFWVAARNTLGEFGPPASFEVWWNNPPTAPGQAFMRVNGLDSRNQIPLVGSSSPPVLTWSPASDVDAGDTMTYEIQVATQPDFGQILGTGRSSIVSSASNVPIALWNLSPVPEPALLYWRVRANDGKQSSEWGPVAVFRLNQPPTRPTGLRASVSE